MLRGVSKLRVGVIFGGRSVEHDVSIVSANSVLRALDPARYEIRLIAVDRDGRWRLGAPDALPESVADGEEVALPAAPGGGALRAVESGALRAMGGHAALDVVLPLVHGTGGEDGCLQGLLELAGVPYVGAGVLGSALQMDKDAAKRLLRAADVPVLDWVALRSAALRADEAAAVELVLREIGLPAFVKPANSGSSVGIARVQSREDLPDALHQAARYDLKLIVERAIPAREIEVALLGNEAPEASVPGEIIPAADWYDYQAKYADQRTRLVVPANLPPALCERMRQLSLTAFRVLEGAGMARADFLLHRETGALYLSELNSLPGFTEGSMFPKLWQASGLPYPALLDRLINLALERAAATTALQRTRP